MKFLTVIFKAIKKFFKEPEPFDYSGMTDEQIAWMFFNMNKYD